MFTIGRSVSRVVSTKAPFGIARESTDNDCTFPAAGEAAQLARKDAEWALNGDPGPEYPDSASTFRRNRADSTRFWRVMIGLFAPDKRGGHTRVPELRRMRLVNSQRSLT